MSTANEPLPQADDRPADTKRRFTTRQIIAAVIIVVALVAIFQNTKTGEFDFLFFHFTAPVWLWLLAVFAAGVATGLLLAHSRARRKAAQK